MPLFFFDLTDGVDSLSNLVELSLADETAARIKALVWVAEMTKGLPIGRHDVSVLVRNGSGCPLFRIGLTLDCMSRTKVAAGRQLTSSNEMAIISSDSALIH